MSESPKEPVSAPEVRVAPGARGKTPLPGGEDLSEGHLEKIRDILVGGQMREVDRRFARLDERLLKVSGELRDDLRKRLDSLEGYVKAELEALTVKLQQEHGERAEAAATLARELKEAAATVDRKIAQLSDHGAKGQRDLRQQLLEQSKRLSDDIEKAHQQITAALDAAVHELRADKLDRAALANLLTEVALRLTDEFKLPGVGPSPRD